jgi:cell division protein FtsL
MRLKLEHILGIACVGLCMTALAIILVKDLKIEKLNSRIKELENNLNHAELEARVITSEIKVIKERREILDSLHKSNIKNRNNEKIKLIESACDSTIKRIVLEHIGSE